MVTSGLDASGLTLLRVEPATADVQGGRATVFASQDGIGKLRQKIEDFREKNRTKKDGSEGRPFNADLVQSIGAIVEAGLRALWRSPKQKFPEGNDARPWEIWLDKATAPHFIAGAPEYGVVISTDRLEFPEDVVVIGTSTSEALALAVRRLGGVRALAAPTVTATTLMRSRSRNRWSGWMMSLAGQPSMAAPIPTTSYAPVKRTLLSLRRNGT